MDKKSHSLVLGYLLWIFGFFGAHRFYYGKPISGTIWLCTLGIFGIGWIVDFFLIPSMDREANQRFRVGRLNYDICWVLLILFGWLGLHRFYMGKVFTGLIYLLTVGLFGIGLFFDIWTLNEQIEELNILMV